MLSSGSLEFWQRVLMLPVSDKTLGNESLMNFPLRQYFTQFVGAPIVTI